MSFDTADQANQKVSEGGFDSPSKEGDSQPFLVIDDRVFHTQEDVIKYYKNANSHISKLEQEAKARAEEEEALRKAAEDNLSARELLEGIRKASTSKPSSETPSMSQEEIVAETVRIAKQEMSEQLKSEAQKALEEKHLAEATEKAKQCYGSEYLDKVLEVGKQHGLNGAQITNLAKVSPDAFAKLFLPEQKETAGPTSTEFNTSSFNQQSNDKPVPFMKMITVSEKAAEVQRRIQAKTEQAKRGEL